MSDAQLQERVIEELRWDPRIHAQDIAVTVGEGVVTLQGKVATYPEKLACERAARRVRGMRALAEEIVVDPGGTTRPCSDADLARTVLDTLAANVLLAAQPIQVKVEHGWVLLSGTVHWGYRERAGRGGGALPGGGPGPDERHRGRAAGPTAPGRGGHRDHSGAQRELSAYDIRVDAAGGSVTLRGTVDSWQAKTEAARAAWAAPGVTAVHNDIVIEA